MKMIVSLMSSIAIIVTMASPSQALEVKKTTRRVVEAMCGGGIQSGGGHTGCNICTSNGKCTDYDCTKKGCKLVNIFKVKPGSIRTGGATTVKGGSGERNGKTIHHPVNVGVTNPPTEVKTPIAVGKGGGMNQSGRHNH
jgi:hypothetical protein